MVKEDSAHEIKLFLSFLHHSYYRRNREKILSAFPDLRDKLDMAKDERLAVSDFIKQFYKENQPQIEKVVQDVRVIFENKSGQALKELGSLMDYQWERGIVYTAIPTVLPFSPFQGNTFFFSILADLKKRQTKDKNALSVAIHEISHFIFLKQIKEGKLADESKKLSKETLDYLKEALAVVVLNQPSLRKILLIEGYIGNSELKNLRVKDENETPDFVGYLEKQYENMREEKGFFRRFLGRVLKKLYASDSEFKKKWEIWNQLGSVQNDEKLRLEKVYSEPIVLQAD